MHLGQLKIENFKFNLELAEKKPIQYHVIIWENNYYNNHKIKNFGNLVFQNLHTIIRQNCERKHCVFKRDY